MPMITLQLFELPIPLADFRIGRGSRFARSMSQAEHISIRESARVRESLRNRRPESASETDPPARPRALSDGNSIGDSSLGTFSLFLLIETAEITAGTRQHLHSPDHYRRPRDAARRRSISDCRPNRRHLRDRGPALAGQLPAYDLGYF